MAKKRTAEEQAWHDVQVDYVVPVHSLVAPIKVEKGKSSWHSHNGDTIRVVGENAFVWTQRDPRPALAKLARLVGAEL